MTYDDDRVIALLRESVPPVPEIPDRVSAVRHRAGRQRAALWTQTIGAAASVLLLVGLATAVAKPGGGRRVEPTANPLVGMADAWAREGSVAFEVTSEPVGTPPAVGEFTSAQMDGFLTSRLTGAIERDGNARIDGDMSLLDVFGFGVEPEGDRHFLVVDGVTYRALEKGELAPAGVKWVRTHGGARTGGDDIERLLRLAATFGKDVAYVRQAESRGVPVAEYRMTVPADVANGQTIAVTFAVDADGLPRRIEATLDAGRLFGEDEGPVRIPRLDVVVEAELFGYGDDVRVEAPPAAEVVDEAGLERAVHPVQAASARLSSCYGASKGDEAAVDACYAAFNAALREAGCTGSASRSGFAFECPDGYSAEGDGDSLTHLTPVTPSRVPGRGERPPTSSVVSPTP